MLQRNSHLTVHLAHIYTFVQFRFSLRYFTSVFFFLCWKFTKDHWPYHMLKYEILKVICFIHNCYASLVRLLRVERLLLSFVRSSDSKLLGNLILMRIIFVNRIFLKNFCQSFIFRTTSKFIIWVQLWSSARGPLCQFFPMGLKNSTFCSINFKIALNYFPPHSLIHKQNIRTRCHSRGLLNTIKEWEIVFSFTSVT